MSAITESSGPVGHTAPSDRSSSKSGLHLARLAQGTETSDLLAALRRILRALSRRFEDGDIEQLTALVELRDDVERTITEAVHGLRHDPELPASWADLGRALGVTRQAAQKRYGHVGGSRRRGGQPGHLR